MTALVKNTSENRFTPSTKSKPSGSLGRDLGGFGPIIDRDEPADTGILGRTFLTMLLVLYPAMASVALVLAAFVLSGNATGV